MEFAGELPELKLKLSLEMLLWLAAAAVAGAACLGWSLGRSYQRRVVPVVFEKKMPKVVYFAKTGKKAHSTDECQSLNHEGKEQKVFALEACKLCCKGYKFD